MKVWKIGLIIAILIVFTISPWFVYTRFCLEKYEISGIVLTCKDSIYVRYDSLSASDEENLGKAIGIAVKGKRTISDYIWPIWVMEFKNDKEHNRIFVRGLMDLGSVYKAD